MGRRTVELPPCLGIRVIYDPAMEIVSDSRGLLRWKRIYVGPSFFKLRPEESSAVLAHEAGHCHLKHLEKRLLRLWMLAFPSRMLALIHEHEYEADAFAARAGFGAQLRAFFARLPPSTNILHPPLQSRIERLGG